MTYSKPLLGTGAALALLVGAAQLLRPTSAPAPLPGAAVFPDAATLPTAPREHPSAPVHVIGRPDLTFQDHDPTADVIFEYVSGEAPVVDTYRIFGSIRRVELAGCPTGWRCLPFAAPTACECEVKP